MNHVSKILSLLTSKEKVQGGLILVAMVAMGLIDTLGVVSIMPFVAVLATPSMVHTNKWLQWGYCLFSFSNVNRYLFFLGVLVMAVIVVNNTSKAWFTWYMTRYTNMCRHFVSRRMMESYLCKPYVFFLNRNTAELGKNVLSVS